MVFLCRFARIASLLTRATISSSNVGACLTKPILRSTTCSIIRQTHPGINVPAICASPFHRFYRSTIFRRTRHVAKKEPSMKPQKDNSENIDDLKSIMQDKTLSMTAKFKVLFKQYGVVLVVVHCITAAFWMSIFYFAVSRGFDIVPFLEEHGVFSFLERIGLPASEKLKSPGASNLLAAYLLYEVAKPVRYPVTIIGTIYAVRFLRHFKYFKRPPQADATVRELVQTQGKIVHHHFKSTASKYQERYGSRIRRSGKKNGHHKKNGRKQ